MSIIEENLSRVRSKRRNSSRSNQQAGKTSTAQIFTIPRGAETEVGFYPELSQAKDIKDLRQKTLGIVNRIGFSVYTTSKIP